MEAIIWPLSPPCLLLLNQDGSHHVALAALPGNPYVEQAGLELVESHLHIPPLRALLNMCTGMTSLIPFLSKDRTWLTYKLVKLKGP